jgi:hypothetical protein
MRGDLVADSEQRDEPGTSAVAAWNDSRISVPALGSNCQLISNSSRSAGPCGVGLVPVQHRDLVNEPSVDSGYRSNAASREKQSAGRTRTDPLARPSIDYIIGEAGGARRGVSPAGQPG